MDIVNRLFADHALFCGFAFGDHARFLRMAALLCTHQHTMGIRRW